MCLLPLLLVGVLLLLKEIITVCSSVIGALMKEGREGGRTAFTAHRTNRVIVGRERTGEMWWMSSYNKISILLTGV